MRRGGNRLPLPARTAIVFGIAIVRCCPINFYLKHKPKQREDVAPSFPEPYSFVTDSVTRMMQSVIQGFPSCRAENTLDCASLHPGYSRAI